VEVVPVPVPPAVEVVPVPVPPAIQIAPVVPAVPAYPGVPIIPEADSVVLVLGGLVAVGTLAGLRRLRQARRQEVSES
jgi:hypothetical protein